MFANGLQTQQHLPWQVAALSCLALGAFVGLINGVLVTRANINSFIATLGSGTLLLGANQWYTGGRQVVGTLPHDFLLLSGKLPYIGIPAAVVYVAIIALVLWIVFDYLPLGRFLYVIGDSPRAAELSGGLDPDFRHACVHLLRHTCRFRRDRTPGSAPGRTKHGRTGADAAGVHGRSARRHCIQARTPQRLCSSRRFR